MSAVVVAVGARTPVGYRADASAAAVRCGLSALRDHPFMVGARGEPIRGALDHGLDPARQGGIRLAVMARSALQEALESVRLDQDGGLKLDVLLALPEERPGLTAANAAWVARELTHGLTPAPAELSARGHAGALEALRQAVARITDGSVDLCAIVGVDSYFAPDTLDWLEAGRRLAGSTNRDGFFPGEAAGCVIVASRFALGALQLPRLARVSGAHAAMESRTIASDAEVLGHGLADAVLGATGALRLPAEAVDDVYGDINGERYRADEWGFALLRAGRALRAVQCKIPASSWGDVGAASGALGCVLAVRAWVRGYAAGPRTLVWGGSDHGLRAAVMLQAPEAG
jgi:3-oxoacyl-[acyl-carrier-protein] synthase-1